MSDTGGASDEAPLIELAGYSFQYRAQSEPTLHDIDLTVRRGEKIAIVGASGSGKSTLISAINGLIPHHHRGTSNGAVRVAGNDPAMVPLAATASVVGTVLQDSNSQFVGLTVAEDIAFSLENQQVPHAEMPALITRAAELAGISDRLDDSPQNLSGGQKQRVAVAGVLVDDVEVLLLDEPLANLDPASGRAAIELLDDLHRDQRKTILLVEHRLEDVLHRDIDRLVLMADGRIVADAAPDVVLASGLLEQHGIRPPLHIAALRYAGAPATAEQRPSRSTDIALTAQQITAVRDWVATAGSSLAAEPEAAEPSPALAPALDLQDVRCEVRVSPERTSVLLDGITAQVHRGEMLGVLGSNGAGKSTLARVICGFEKLTGGALRIGAADASGWSLSDRGEHVGFVLQEPGQMISRPLVSEEIALGLRARGEDEEEIARRTTTVLTACGLAPFRSWPLSALSHGQKKRVTIASVLALGPDVLILDEPTAGQDFAHYTEFMQFLRTLNADGTTVVLITHDMHLAVEYTDRVLVLSDGRLLADADPAVVLTDPDLTRRADLVTTGLYELARRCGLRDPHTLVHRFVAVDRAAREEER
ncbi:ATP-binding cassette domain-containing protein [Brachybacterium sp. JB7]|uniref:Heme ABC transporter ATP-binding protein n=1 Tax=Brachybacterium alimentarium TaxID=47845 RepID=A0A2A3YLT7_9MICO|nr:heme ABC transporter ATP-binding protein [Brachybacterium alimentarium]RCS65860.1 ATP-binding cassette domain-containing protein [Brachybacterium sp. JB7]PCC40250.1 heme ABC transporter ATP-binding protein [Brachybacterium alimentarium]RCS69501.1 ATP-binding cassette domain-containing protein [Brachybacterium alimentarium]RCS71458.1 ATP-binding cassette domain-containing protein [Brachybacterium alimentarium]